jgi:hypothetical protein
VCHSGGAYNIDLCLCGVYVDCMLISLNFKSVEKKFKLNWLSQIRAAKLVFWSKFSIVWAANFILADRPLLI